MQVKPLAKSKSRLQSVLSQVEREELSLRMLQDVLEVTLSTDEVEESLVVSSDSKVLDFAESKGVSTLKEDRADGVNAAVRRGNTYFLRRGFDSTVVIPSDLPLMRPIDLKLVIDAGRSGDCVVIAPSERLDGTNVLLRSPPDVIKTWFDQDSFRSHCEEAKRMRVGLKIIFSRRLMKDIDNLEDLKELLSIPALKERYSFLKSKLPPGTK